MATNSELFLELYYQGLSNTKISEILKINRKSVDKLRNDLGLPRRTSSIKYGPQITELVNKGLNDGEISRELGINHKQVEYIRNRRLKLKTNNVIKKYFDNLTLLKSLMLRNLRHSAKARNLEFNLTIDDLNLPTHCPILGIKLSYGKDPNTQVGASVDRIDNTKGYVKGNIVIMSRKANAMKNSASIDELQTFINNIQKLITFYKDQGALGSITDVFSEIKFITEDLVSTSSRCTYKSVSA